MKTSLLKQFRKVFSNDKANLNIKLVVFSFFFIVATILWYLNKLSYEYSTDIVFPLKLENMPKGKVMVGTPPSSLTLGVRAYGYTLIRYKIASSLSPININLNQVPLIHLKDSETKHYILTSRLRNSIINQLKGELQLERIYPDSLYFEFTQLESKKVKVASNMSYSMERQHMLSGPITVIPDSITISGPSTLIDTINEVVTIHHKLDKLTETEIRSVNLFEITQVGFSHRRVNVTIPVEKFTEANFVAEIQGINLPDSLRLVLIPRTVNAKCNVIVSQYRNIGNGLVDFFVDFNDTDSSIGNQLRIQMSSRPYVVNNIDFEPKYVQFIIEKI